MKKALTNALTTLALIMALSVAAFAGHGNVARPAETDAADTATQTAPGHGGLRGDGHPN